MAQLHVFVRKLGKKHKFCHPKTGLIVQYETVFCIVCGKAAKGYIDKQSFFDNWPDTPKCGIWPNEKLEPYCDETDIEQHNAVIHVMES